MSELQQLRKEINELRERIAKLESRPAPVPVDLFRYGERPLPPVGSPLADAWKYSPTPLWLEQKNEGKA